MKQIMKKIFAKKQPKLSLKDRTATLIRSDRKNADSTKL